MTASELITIDIGNSSIGIGRRLDERWIVQRVREPREAAMLIRGDSVAISVAPTRFEQLRREVSALGYPRIRELQRPPPRLTFASPELLLTAGSDRIANALALLPGPGIAVDAGTAVTIDVVDSAGVYRGGFIAAGPGASSAGLAAITAQLPFLTGMPAKLVPGDNTADALGAGLWGAAIGGVDRLVECAIHSLSPGSPACVVATGGWGRAWAAESRHSRIHDEPNLVHIGIARWAEWM